MHSLTIDVIFTTNNSCEYLSLVLMNTNIGLVFSIVSKSHTIFFKYGFLLFGQK